MRGRLINPVLAKIAQIDLASMETSSKFDSVFREPTVAGPSALNRLEQAPILLPCQVEDGNYERMDMRPQGDDPESRLVIVFHFQDLEDANLVDANGQPLLRLGDRIVSLHRLEDESLIMTMGLDGQGFFATELQPQSFGLSGGERNLLLVTFECRNKTVK